MNLRVMLVVLGCLVMMMAFSVQAQEPTVSIGTSEEFGEILVGSEGWTLYQFDNDPLDESVCVDACLANWPALTVEDASAVSAAEGVPGELGTIERADGSLQVTYNGIPLYYWVNDAEAGQTNGHGVGGVWWVVSPATVYVEEDDELGSILVGPTGLSLYKFTQDTKGEASVCNGDCAAAWPPLTVESDEDIVAALSLPGELSTIEREDGSLQVAYNGWPLYTFASDAARGDTTGEGVGDVWFTLVPETLVLSNNADLGDFLAAANGFTVYKFDQDSEGVSNCSGGCADSWPPLTVGEHDRLAASAGIEGELGTIEREDGSLQVTYNGWPLYFFASDTAAGDTTGQGVGDVWWVVAP